MERFSYSRNGVQGRVDENCQVRVGITGVDTSSGKHVLYRVRMVNLQTRQAWEVSRRFSEFFKLRNELLAFLQAADKKCPGCVNYQKVLLRFEFPRKHIFTSDSPVVLNYRRNALTSFVALLASHTFTSSPKCPTCSGFSFTAVRDFLTEGLVVMDGNAANSPIASDDKQVVARDTIRESMNVKDFTDYHPVSSLRHVNSDGKFTSEMRVNTHKPKPKPKPATHKEHSNKHERHTKQASASKRDATHKQKTEVPLPSPPVKQRNSLSSTGSSSSDPVSPGSLPPSPQNVKKSSKKVLEYNEEEKEEDEDEGFSSFVIPKSTADKPAAVETVEVAAAQKTKKKFNFTSSPRESMERGSTINFDDDDDDDNDDNEDEDEDINLDFMKSVSVAKA